MKSLMSLILLPGILFFVTPSQAAESKKVMSKKTKAHHCAIFRRNAMKAKHRYAMARAKAEDLNKQVKVLKEDQDKLPDEAKTTKNIVRKKIDKLSTVKTVKLAMSLKYLENHIYYVKAARKTCDMTKTKVPLLDKKEKDGPRKIYSNILYEIASQ